MNRGLVLFYLWENKNGWINAVLVIYWVAAAVIVCTRNECKGEWGGRFKRTTQWGKIFSTACCVFDSTLNVSVWKLTFAGWYSLHSLFSFFFVRCYSWASSIRFRNRRTAFWVAHISELKGNYVFFVVSVWGYGLATLTGRCINTYARIVWRIFSE